MIGAPILYSETRKAGYRMFVYLPLPVLNHAFDAIFTNEGQSCDLLRGSGHD